MLIGAEKTVLSYSLDTLMARPTYADSWDPMYRGLRGFQSGEDPTIYKKIFFDQKHKFQYPPTSLIIIEAITRVVGGGERLRLVLDWVSWLSVIGTVFVTILIFRDGLRLYVPEEERLHPLLAAILVMIFAFTFYPLLRAYVLGQIQTWLNFLFTLGLWFWLRQRKAISGLCLGLIAVVKPQMGLFFFWGLLRKYWKFCVFLAGIAAVFLALSIWRYGLPAHFKYVEVLSYIAERGETYYPNQSVNGLMNRLLMNGNNLEWSSSQFAPPNEVVRWTTFATTLILIVGGLWAFRKMQGDDSWAGFAAAGLAFTMASPVAWEHHYGILLPIFAITLPKLWQLQTRWRGGLIWLGTAYLLTANLYLFTNKFANTPLNFVQSYLFFGGLIMLGILINILKLSNITRVVD